MLLLLEHGLNDGRSLDPHSGIPDTSRPLRDGLDGIDLLCSKVESIRKAPKLYDLELLYSHVHICSIIDCYSLLHVIVWLGL